MKFAFELIPFVDDKKNIKLKCYLEIKNKSELLIQYIIDGPLGYLNLPAITPTAKRKDLLWESTCFELFIKSSISSYYREWNFAPNGDWQSYDFSEYRKLIGPANVQPPKIEQVRKSDSTIIQAHILGDDFYAINQLNCSAVIEDTDKHLSYWSILHPKLKPDFHSCWQNINQIKRET